MIHKIIYLFFLILIFSFSFLGCKYDREENKKQLPNIVWLVAEDQSPEFLPIYGDSTVKLPIIESLAKDAIVFNNAYTPAPVCAPARSAIITGLYPTTLGTHNMRTYNSYKKENEPTIGIPSYSPIVPKGVKMFPQYLRKIGYYTSNNSKEDYNFKKTDGVWDDSSSNAHWKNRAAGQPFFAVFNFGISHESQIWEQGDNDILVDQKLVQIPPYFPDTHEIRKDIAVNYSNLIRLDKKIGKIINELKQEGLYEKSIIFFYSDHGGPFPRHKRSLYETGIKVPLIIKLPYSKYGGTENNNFISFIDYAPSILSMVGIKPPDVMQGKAQFGKFKVNYKVPYIFAASDRFDEKVDRLRAVRYNNFKYIRNFNPKISNAIPVSYREQMPMMGELNKLWKENLLIRDHSLWFKTPKPKEELYDLNKDPFELRNLADEIRLKDTLFFLREVLDQWIIHTNDLGEYSEKELIEKWFKGTKSNKLKSISFKKKYGKIILEHFDSGSTILWKGDKDSIWNIYSKPISYSKSVIAKAVRIGYEDSDQIKID